jgi:hypothetical protein
MDRGDCSHLGVPLVSHDSIFANVSGLDLIRVDDP